jgi:hypothetical protein
MMRVQVVLPPRLIIYGGAFFRDVRIFFKGNAYSEETKKMNNDHASTNNISPGPSLMKSSSL